MSLDALYRRLDSLLNLRYQLALIILSLFSAIWVIIGTIIAVLLKTDSLGSAVVFFVGILSTSSLFLIWRYLTHFIGSDQAACNILIIQEENRLHLPKKFSTLQNLEANVYSFEQRLSEEKYSIYQNFSNSQKINLLKQFGNKFPDPGIISIDKKILLFNFFLMVAGIFFLNLIDILSPVYGPFKVNNFYWLGLLFLFIVVFVSSFIGEVYLIFSSSPSLSRLEEMIADVSSSQMNETVPVRQVKNYDNSMIVLLGICCVIIAISLSYFFGYALTKQSYDNTLNEYFESQYHLSINQSGEKNLQVMLNNVTEIDNTKKLNQIANEITKNFSNPFWNDTTDSFYPNSCSSSSGFYYHFFGNRINQGYGYNKNKKIRVMSGNFTQLPNVIAYEKTGACEELSILFAYVSNRSGFVTRVVYSDDIGHRWNEVLINETEWSFFDSDIYHQRQGNLSYQSDWFGDRCEYKKNWGKNLTVYIYDSDANDPLNNLTPYYSCV